MGDVHYQSMSKRPRVNLEEDGKRTNSPSQKRKLKAKFDQRKTIKQRVGMKFEQNSLKKSSIKCMN